MDMGMGSIKDLRIRNGMVQNHLKGTEELMPGLTISVLRPVFHASRPMIRNVTGGKAESVPSCGTMTFVLTRSDISPNRNMGVKQQVE